MSDKLLNNLLAEKLGELLYQKDNCFDWEEKDNIKEKINAIYVLLDIDKKEETFMNSIIRLA